MKPPTSVFQVGRMRHIDLLELWHLVNPDAPGYEGLRAGRMPHDQLAAAILGPAQT